METPGAKNTSLPTPHSATVLSRSRKTVFAYLFHTKYSYALLTCFTPSTAMPGGKCHLRKTISQVTRCWRREWQPPQRETQSPALPALVPVSLRLRLSGASRPPAPSLLSSEAFILRKVT